MWHGDYPASATPPFRQAPCRFWTSQAAEQSGRVLLRLMPSLPQVTHCLKKKAAP